MKKTIVLLLLAVLSFNTYLAQEDGIMKKGNSSINLYYGFNVFTRVYKNFLQDNAIEMKYKQKGPYGIVYEYLVTDAVGLGAELGYSDFSISFKENTTDVNGNPVAYDWVYRWNTSRLMFRANYHFAESEDIDAYGLFSVGYRLSQFSFSSNDPNVSSFNYNYNVLPLAIKPGIGLRYFFLDNMGFNLELAIGTPIICGGITFKFQ